MDLLNGNLKKIFFKYLSASFGSALVLAIYSIVDCAMVGQYEGSAGVAALAAFAPVWNIIYSLGLLGGIGGAVLMSTETGRGNTKKGNELFTSAAAFIAVICVAEWLLITVFKKPLLRFFGADTELLDLALKYMKWINIVLPTFTMGQFLAAFLRNDSAPEKATAAVIAGGIFNILGDYFFVFVCNMGITGAGLATALGQLISTVILISHFFTKKCTLKFVKPKKIIQDIKKIFFTGFSTFFIDLALGIFSVAMNNQIMRYAGSSALAVYGVIINVNILVQSGAYAIGQAAQPIISVNYGAMKTPRIAELLKTSVATAFVLGFICAILTMAFPTQLINVFMKPDSEVLKIAPEIMRIYFMSFILLPFNIFSTYYFQAIMKPMASFVVAALRGVVLSGALIFLLPLVGGEKTLWTVMPLTEFLVASLVLLLIKKYAKVLTSK